ncbi:MliC family protein [Marivita sp. GX14005]|uniref:MliC family protein n=1 Tax=Marivita sp. GX14005 TaxID=2942276 RepID=UPI002018FB50|nr:MliC family protein [Marivita sp. GX14005]MCL3880974.1 MliC family protein [Marivita sp. GX14005]
MRSYWIALVCTLASPLAAQDAPSFDCAKAKSEAERLVCSDSELARLDRRLAERYSAALDRVGEKETRNLLRAYQRGWIKGRDACWKADDARECVRLSYLMRESELVARWQLEPELARDTWRCGKAGKHVTTVLYETDLQALRFEIDGEISTASQVRTASGIRYTGDFGREIWMKGDTARYREADPDGTEYDCTRIED